MYRVVTKYRNGGTRPVTELGPWHSDRATAEHWAEVLRNHGYDARVESQSSHGFGSPGEDHNELAAALASMA